MSLPGLGSVVNATTSRFRVADVTTPTAPRLNVTLLSVATVLKLLPRISIVLSPRWICCVLAVIVALPTIRATGAAAPILLP